MRKYFKYLTGLITILILYFLISQINFQDINEVLKSVKLSYLFWALIAYIGVNSMRSLRYYYLLQKNINFWKIFEISFAHAFINAVMPARIGELSYVYYINRVGGVSAGKNVASLFISRAFDTLAVVLFMLASLPFTIMQVSSSSNVLFIIFSGSALLTTLFILFIFCEKSVLNFLDRVFDILNLHKYNILNKLHYKFREALEAIGGVREPVLFLRILLFSILNWVFIFLLVWLVAIGFGIKMSFWQAVFSGGLPALANIVPFYSVGNFGLYEGSKSLGMTLMGFSKELSISFSFISHVAEILVTTIPGIITFFTLYFNSRLLIRLVINKNNRDTLN